MKTRPYPCTHFSYSHRTLPPTLLSHHGRDDRAVHVGSPLGQEPQFELVYTVQAVLLFTLICAITQSHM